ncbi:hypothetical protein Nepgr_006861 [Nepenthes gracilis]|uniref:Uncharacterized protein n=1 Tax=Nepenthes gracilis TaxID=150966 RepID=A0AAD3S615_NEPGR|nr:hypothetical protein Nepgr_006861 [Nepenthes gracilis]
MDDDQYSLMGLLSCGQDTITVAIAKVDVPLNTVKVGNDPCPMEMSKHSPNTADRGDDSLMQMVIVGTPIVFHDPSMPVASAEAEHSSQVGPSSQVEAIDKDGGTGISQGSQQFRMAHLGLLKFDSRLAKLQWDINLMGKALRVFGDDVLIDSSENM